MNLIAFCFEPKLFAAFLHIPLGGGTGRQVQNGTAAGTHKVCVGTHIPVIPLLAIDRSHPLDEPMLTQLAEIAVHRAQTQVWIHGPELLKDPVCRGVAVGASQQVQHGVALYAASADHCCHLTNRNCSC